MSRIPRKYSPSMATPGIDWHDQQDTSGRKKKETRPKPGQRLATMSELVRYLAQSAEIPTLADIERLQILARGQDIDIASLEI